MGNETNMPNATAGHHVTVGNITALLMLAFAIIAGGWYMLSGRDIQPALNETTAPTAATTDAATTALSMQGTSDDVANIEADLDATDLSSLDEISAL